MDKKVLYDLSYGVYLTTTMDGERPTGCVTNSVMQITSAPMSIAVSVNHENYTNSCMKKCGKFAVSILAQDSDPALIGTFGFQSGRDVDKFETVACTMVEGVPVVNDGGDRLPDHRYDGNGDPYRLSGGGHRCALTSSGNRDDLRILS